MASASLAKCSHPSSDFPRVHFISKFDIQDILRGSVTVRKGNIKKIRDSKNTTE